MVHGQVTSGHLLWHYAGDSVRPGVYSESTLDYHILSANCIGNETSIYDCPYTRMQQHHVCNSEAGIICQGS